MTDIVPDELQDTPKPSPSLTAVAEYAAEIIRERIIKGDLGPGARIVERKLAAELSLSRTPIREALKLLRADGLVEISRNSGARVVIHSPEEILALFDVIGVIESLAAERFAARITDAELQELETLHAEMLAYYADDNTDDYFRTNSAIHDAVIAGAHNPSLAEAHRRLIARTRHGRFMAIMNPARWRQSVDEHETLMAALRNRDALAAAEIWRAHLLHTGETTAEVLRQAARSAK
ncbi:GntR family transcriptional regulator [Falsirhodobacter sp. alg1]|uniref:GntR family transcriptional regulator n=1 Tax=Falsirhodobacter sp. alg1 TaxID=1472418 RepID=UPI000ACF7EFB|nr:GntR family transcriptional regulator [Falsirhodobacter sp. alg1]